MQCPMLGTSDDVSRIRDMSVWIPWIPELKRYCLSGNHGDCNVYRGNSGQAGFCVVPEVVIGVLSA